LYTYFRSSAAYRVRIALQLKQVDYASAAVHLVRGEQRAPGFHALNPQDLVPVLEDDGAILTQSLAILEYLDETHPAPPLLPADAGGRARVRALAQIIACEIHPLNNLRVLGYLEHTLALGAQAKSAWYAHWIKIGFDALEARLSRDSATGQFCHADSPGLADCCLIPQIYNARRFDVDFAPYPTLLRIEDHCAALDAFRRAAPEQQPDAG
jgi:maleylacetoacetate isomerase/maleylpyruvate isomerase